MTPKTEVTDWLHDSSYKIHFSLYEQVRLSVFYSQLIFCLLFRSTSETEYSNVKGMVPPVKHTFLVTTDSYPHWGLYMKWKWEPADYEWDAALPCCHLRPQPTLHVLPSVSSISRNPAILRSPSHTASSLKWVFTGWGTKQNQLLLLILLLEPRSRCVQ